MFDASRSPLFALALLLPALACGTEPGSDDASVSEGSTGAVMTTTGMPGTTGVQEDSGTTAAPPPGTTTNDPDSTTAVAEEGPPPVYFDLGILPDAPPLDYSCGKVDFLFVIDNSGSMGDEQATLVANFPAFIDGIQATLENVDTIHLGVTTTDDYSSNIAGCQTLSSLVVQTNSGVCGPYDEGANYMTEMDNLDVAFSCAALVGTNGSASERAMGAAVGAVTGVNGGPGQCNFGFMREDALLVIVIITDESDTNSPGNPMTWYNDIVAAKAGIPENVVVVSIINTPMGVCGFDLAFGIADFTAMFGMNGFMADICVPDFAPIFEEAIGIIDIACDNYIPPN